MSPRQRARHLVAQVPHGLGIACLVRETIRVCLRYRVTGLASEAGYFALLSLPPLVLGLVGGLGFVGGWLGPDAVDQAVEALTALSKRFLTDASVSQVIVPTMDEVLRSGRLDVLSVGFLLSLWSGSRALNVFLDTISIMYGQSGVRGIVRSRALSFTVYTVAVAVGAVVLPLVLVGPDLLVRALSLPADVVARVYWPAVGGTVVIAITLLFHIATPRRSPWQRDLPGAVLTVVLWVLASYGVRAWLGASVGGTSVYGPLAAPIVLLVWLYVLATAVLVGAAMNAAIREMWPLPDQASSRERVVTRVRCELDARRELAAARAASDTPVSPWGPVIAGLVPAPASTARAGASSPGSGRDAQASSRLDSPQRHRLVSVSTPGA